MRKKASKRKRQRKEEEERKENIYSKRKRRGVRKREWNGRESKRMTNEINENAAFVHHAH